MTQLSPKSGVARLSASLALIALMLLSGCAMIERQSPTTQEPQVACEERAPTEDAYPLPSGSEIWQEWRKAALAWLGIATAEAEKRATTAECLDRLRELGVIR